MGSPDIATYVTIFLALCTLVLGVAMDTDEAQARAWLADYNARVMKISNAGALASWTYQTNITDYNSDKSVKQSLVGSQFSKDAAKNASTFHYEHFTDPALKRQFASIAVQGVSGMKNTTKLERLNKIEAEMGGIYSKAKVCGIPGRGCLSLEPGLTRLLAESRDYDELALAWKRWRDVSGGKMKDLYTEFVQLSNEAVQDGGGFNDTGEYWRSWYESDTFEQDLQRLLEELKPLYKSLHAYVRRRLQNDTYPDRTFPTSGHIPAHILGNMWSQSWSNVYDRVEPFPGRESIDVTPAMKAQHFNATHMFRIAEDFFTSLGLRPMTPEFWQNSMIERPTDGREVVCHASAWDLSNGNDTRIKMCTDITMNDLITIHHEMGHIQYYLQYQTQPPTFQNGANPGFHEAIGDVLALSASTPKHLHTIGLLDKVENNTEADINYLMYQALDKVAFLPFGYLIDQWRWSVFRGDTTPDQYTKKWWDLRCKYQGISPPVPRSQDDLFDPGAKHHIASNTPYIRYFVSFVLQFQIHEALCNTAGQTGPLYQCDIYKSKAAGDKLGELLKLGASKPWQDILYEVIGTRNMSATSILKYFQPLITWLDEQNQGHPTGWNESCPDVQCDIEAEMAPEIWLSEYNDKAQDMLYMETVAEWNYATNITDHNQEIAVQESLVSSQFSKDAAKNASEFDYKTFTDPALKRQFEAIAVQGVSAMKNVTKLERLNKIEAELGGIYSKAKVCDIPFHDCLSLEPGLTRLLAESRDYDELALAWKHWRDVSGGQMKDLYTEFVKLSNEGVRDGGGFNDTGEYWRSWYESNTFEKDLQRLLEELQPLYQSLHAYIRRKLSDAYPDHPFPTSGHIPAHILGNMWSQSWINVYNLVEPFPGRVSIDVTPTMKAKNIDACQMFEIAEDFFTSLGLRPMSSEFWERSMIERPTDGREVECHASAWDFYRGNDTRIKMCTDIVMDDLVTIHHEMGHIQYFLQYQDQPVSFRDGANPGFHEAIGDVLALSASTPKHLHTIGLLDKLEDTAEADINYLMYQALDRIAFLPFGYLIDQWRWSVFRGDTTSDQYTSDWWDLRCKYQGISPPISRSGPELFDPGAKNHVATNTPYIRYFVSSMLQFQIHEALCKTAGQTGPLYQCDIYNSTAAGDQLGKLLKLGSSKPWQDILFEVIETRNMSARPILEYFKPLIDWLDKENKGHQTGWMDACPDVQYDIEAVMAPKIWLSDYNKKAKDMKSREIFGEWNYGSNITDYNMNAMVNLKLEQSDFDKAMAKEANEFPWNNYTDENIRRQFQKITNIGTNALEDKTQLKEMADLQAHIEGIYGKAKVTMSSGKTLSLEPGLTKILTHSRNETELKESWIKWREQSGNLMKHDYEQFVHLSNVAVQELGYADTGAYWRSFYETETFEHDLAKLLDELRPLYRLLHAYVRKQLIKEYGAENFPRSGHIPAHLLGNMWAQQWNNIYDLVEPYKGEEAIDVTPEMLRQKYTVKKMFETAEDFFVSLGLKKMPKSFWNGTIMTNPEGVTMVCHASAWEFFNYKDFRIKMCTEVNMEEMVVVHHEMGHIQYFLQYNDQPLVFHEGANPGFHEAIGDVMALSVSTPKHLHTIGLMDNMQSTTHSEINFLMKMALEKIAFLPFGYLIDQWRWSVFSGETPADKYNEKWWQLRCKHQGISPPVERSERDFDPGAKYHIPANVPYIRYFVSFVVQFQFHEALCKEAGHTGPLHQCDIFNSTAAGTLLSNMLKLGSSKPWPDAMRILTGTDKMAVSSLMNYFKPLTDWLKQHVTEDEGDWSEECTHVTEGDEARAWLSDYEQTAEKEYSEEVEVDWAYNTDITDEHAQQQVESSLKTSKFEKEAVHNASHFNWREYKDERMHRQIEAIVEGIGTSALDDEQKLKQLADVHSQMAAVYSKGKVCMTPGKCLKLEPGLTELMATSRDYNELLDAWKGWRDATGKKLPGLYAQMVDISNEAMQHLGYQDYGAYWRSMYETETFQTDLQDLLEQLQPLYLNLHTYVRRELVKLYGADKFPQGGHIPAHLLGNMWAQGWNNLNKELQPFKNKQSVDVTPTLVARGYNASTLFHYADDFFKSLGLKPMPPPFWAKSMMVRPPGKEVVCHASAWDFYNRHDYRIKMCTAINMEDFITIHHEMGHVQYYLQYAHQPTTFRSGANPGFHEAIGDVMALSVATPKHLRRVGLLQDQTDDAENEINFLMMMALEKIAFLPFGYLIDQWRWSVFSGETPPEKYNEKWWELRCKYQGVSPPIERSSTDFDPGAKFHIPGNYPYIRYFVSYVIQFQFHQALCRAANHTGPLHKCDIYQSKEAGKLLRCKYQGVSPPIERSSTDFDPGAKFHIPGNYPYIRYFVSYVIQFQFHQALCRAANHTGPLHKCDIYQSKEAGKLLSDTLSLGSSKPWPDAMEKLTGQRKMDVGPILDYFRPLISWLEEQNRHERAGWSPACPTQHNKDGGSSISGATSLVFTYPVTWFITLLLLYI